LLLRPRPVADPDRLVELYTGERQRPYETTSYPSYVEFRERSGVFSGLAAYAMWQFTLTDSTDVEQVWGEVVSANYFDVLGVLLSPGRGFVAADELTPGGGSVVVISHGLWQRRFNGDPDLVGRTISINGQTLTIAGIAPRQFTGMFRGIASEVWVPTASLPALEPLRGHARLVHRGNRWLMLVGRLEPGTSLEQARARFDLLSLEMQTRYPEEWKSRETPTGAERELFVSVLPERDTRVHPALHGGVYAAVALLMGIVNLVLIVACVNLANMLLARAIARRREVAIRLALGAGRGRLIRQFVTESVIVALVAGLAGVVLTIWSLDLLLAWMPSLPEGIRVAVDLELDWRVLAYTFAFSILTGVLFGLAPALHSSRASVSTVLKDESGSVTTGRRTSRTRRVLIVIQVAVSVLLLIGTGLVLRSLNNVQPTRLGFSSEDILVVPVNLDESRYDRAKSQEFYRQLMERVSALSGVQAVSLVEGIPGGFIGRARRSIDVEGYSPAAGESMSIDAAFVGPNYFTTMNVPIVQGRDFDHRDRSGAPCVVIVNEVFARRFFPATASPLGRHLLRGESSEPAITQSCEIVGVIRDDRWQSLEKTVQPFFALTVLQWHQLQRMSLLVHTAGTPTALIDPVRRTVRTLEPAMPVTGVQTLHDTFSVNLYPFRVLSVVMAACGVMALLLATIGVYGTVSYVAAQRTREVGIRIALGAVSQDILRMIVGHGMLVVGLGVTVGLLVSVALTRVLTRAIFETDLLFGVSPTDPFTFIGVTILLMAVAALACYIPARRAANVDPVDALRSE
jgi:predicted permease